MMGDGDDFDEDRNLEVNIANFDHVPFDEESIRQMFIFDEEDFFEEFENVSSESASCDDLYYSPIFERVRGQMSLNIDEFKYHVSTTYFLNGHYLILAVN